MKPIASAALELTGAAALVAGTYFTFGLGGALIVGGLVAVLFGVALDGPIRKRRP